MLGTLVDPNNANPDAFSFSPGATNAHTFTAELNGSYSFTYRYEKPTVTGVVRWWFLTEGVKDVSVGTATDVLLKQSGARTQLHVFLKKQSTYSVQVKILSGAGQVMANLYDPISAGANSSAGMDTSYYAPNSENLHSLTSTVAGEYILSFSYVNSADTGSMSVTIKEG